MNTPPTLLSASHTRSMKILPFLAAAFLVVFYFVARPLLPPPPPADPAITFSMPEWLSWAVFTLSWAIWGSVLFAAWKIKSVIVEGDQVWIRGLRREISVPLHQVAGVEQPIWMPRLARIELHAESEFGSSIWFLPTRGAAVGGVPTLRRLAAVSVGDRAAAPVPPPDYRRSWAQLRLLRIAQIGCLALFFTLPPLIGATSNLALIFAPGIGWIITGFLIGGWACPRCGQSFFGGPAAIRRPSLFVGSCRHCGLQKGADPGAEETTTRR